MFRHLALANLVLGAAIALAATVATAPAALASTYLLSFSSAGGDVGSLKVGLNGTTAIWASGSINGFAITGLSPYAGADQQLFVAGPVHFTVPGLSFSASNGTLYNLTAYPFNSDRITNSVLDPYGYGTPIPYALPSLSIAAIPIPAPLGLILLGFGVLGLLRRGRRVGVALVTAA
jgi:hypothetical protein